MTKGYQEVLSTKQSWIEHSPYGDFTENQYTTWSVIEFTTGQYAGQKFLSRTIRNDYVIVLADQFGSTDSARIAKELGLAWEADEPSVIEYCPECGDAVRYEWEWELHRHDDDSPQPDEAMIPRKAEPEFDRINHGPFEHPVSEPIDSRIQKSAKATMQYIEQVAAKHGIDLQAEMLKSEAVERTLAELRSRK